MVQTELPLKTPAQTVEIKDLDHFIKLLTDWHTSKVKMLDHLRDIPETAEVSIDDGKHIKVSGKFRKGFQLGLAIALSELGKLPFVAELEEAASIDIKH